MDFQHLRLNREQGVPIYLQLYRRYRDAIAGGQLQPGDRVPSVRSLASALNLARGTVETAYQMLVGEGYFVTRGAAGTVVAPGLANLPEVHEARSAVSAARCPAQSPGQPGGVRPFQLGLPALDAFPRKTWVRLAGRSLRTLDASAMSYPDVAGYEPLRRAIASYLGISRGIACSHEQVFVTAGYRGALALVCRTLLQSGDVGWYEDPGYLFARQFLTQAGMRLAAVPVDDEGLNVEYGQQHAAAARFAVVTPTHQSPLGVALSLPRRLALLEWASRCQAWVIEDDYDSEFRYHGKPLPALKSLDRGGRVLYTGTFSKVLFPGLCLAYLVVPEDQIDRFKQAACHLPGPGSILPQAMVADFMEQGHFARHLRKMRALYAERRAYLVNALTDRLGDALHVVPQAGGIHVLAHLGNQYHDERLATTAQTDGLDVVALNRWRESVASGGGLLMGFANFATAEAAAVAVARLAKVFR